MQWIYSEKPLPFICITCAQIYTRTPNTVKYPRWTLNHSLFSQKSSSRMPERALNTPL